MKKLLFAIAGAAAFSAFAADPAAGANDISIVGFENYTADQTVIGYGDNGEEGGSLWSCAGDDASLVKTLGGDNAALPAITEPRPFAGETNTKYLALDTNGSELQRAIPAAGQAVAATGTYIDTLVQFTPSESAPTSADLDGAKLAIWLGVVEGVTNLYVQGNSWDVADGFQGTPQAFALSGKTIDPGTWYRLTVKAVPNIVGEDAGTTIPAFQISVDGTDMTLAASPFSANMLEALENAENAWASADIQTAFAANKLVPAILSQTLDYGTTFTLTSVGFKGTGALDDFVVTTEAPSFGPATIDFSLTWPAGLTAVSYQIGEGEPVAISGASPFAVPGLVGGETVKLIVQNADGAQKTLSATAADGEGIDATGTTFGWADYLGDAVAGAYTIDNFADLDMLRKGVAAGLATAGETFKQTADIDMTSAGAFAGIGTYAKIPTSGTPFLGTYDGQNYMIANVQRAGTDTQGIFNQVGPSGVIENLVVSNMYWDSELSGEYGLAIVGNAGGGATLRNLTAAGTFASASKPSTHNIAGIVVRLSPGAAAGEATTIDSCTNNATIYGGYTKLGGINAIVQNQTGFVNGKVVFVNCANNGTLVCKRTATDVTGNAGIVGYISGTNVELTGCYGNGVITNADGANTDKDGALVGWTYGGTIKDNGGNAAPVGKKMIGTWGSATETGFLYATVDNGVATTVTTLAKDGEYLLEGNAAPVFEFAEAGTIAFDTALGYTLDGTGITAVEGLTLTDATVDTLTTYTAASSSTPLNPGQDDGKTYTTEEAAAEAAASVKIAAATEVATALGETEAANYVTNFEAKAVSNGAGGYTVQVVLKESVEEVLQEQANADAGTVAGALDAATATVTTTPGFYYSVKYGASLEAMNYRTAGELATGASKALTMPAKPGTSGFYKVVIDIAPSAAVAPAQE